MLEIHSGRCPMPHLGEPRTAVELQLEGPGRTHNRQMQHQIDTLANALARNYGFGTQQKNGSYLVMLLLIDKFQIF